jgi:hypothetical protein
MGNKGGYRSSTFLLVFWDIVTSSALLSVASDLPSVLYASHSCIFSFLFFVEALPTMDNENEETKQNLPSDESRTLVSSLP